MGCWNHTCALTNLPVMGGDDVYVFILEEHPFNRTHNYCYPTNFWCPLPIYFEGKYDDYGGVEECHGPLMDTLIDAIRENLIEMPQGENKYHDIPVMKEGFNVEKMFEADHEGRLFVKGMGTWEHAKPTLALRHIVIHKRVLDQLLNEFTIDNYEINPKTNKGFNKTLTYTDFVNDALGYARQIMKRAETGEMSVALMLGYIRTAPGKPGEWFGRMFGSGEMRFLQTINPERLIQDILWKFEKKEDVEATRLYLYDVVRQLALYGWLENFMNHGRRMWIPPSGSGSQNDETTAQRSLARVTLDTAEWLDHRWDEE